jgi:hypothetical protein
VSQPTTYGEWWIETRTDLPEQYVPPAHIVAGALHADGFADWHLETSGSLVEGVAVSPGSLPATRDPQSIWGADLSGNLYSLLYAEHTGVNHRSNHPHGGTQRWHAGAIAQSDNVWVTPEDEVDRLNIHLRYLETWIQDSEPNVDYDHETGTITAPPEARTVVAHVGETKVELRWGTDRQLPTNSAGTSVSLTPRAVIRVEGDRPISDIYDDWVHPLRLLYSLFSMRPSTIDSVNGRLAGLSDDTDDIEAWRQPRVELRFPQPFSDNYSAESTDDDGLSWYEMLATRAALANAGFDFDQLLPAFFGLLDGSWTDVALDCLVESQVKQRGFTFDDMFLYAFKGIESLHNHWFGVQTRELLDKVVACFDNCGDTATALRSAYDNIEIAIRDERNAVVHARKQRQRSNQQTALLSAMQWLLRHSLLQAMGLSRQICDGLITNHLLFKGVVRDLERH